MSEVTLTVPAPKEVVDFLKAADTLVAKLVAKESLGQVVVEEFQAAQVLYGEYQAAVGELHSDLDGVIDATELYVRRIVYRLLGKPVAPVLVEG